MRSIAVINYDRMVWKSRFTLFAVVLLALVALTTGCSSRVSQAPPVVIQLQTAQTASIDANHLLLGNPSKATPDFVTNGNNFLLARPQYVLSYNNAKKIPNWVSWQLNRNWLGKLPRQNNFRPDDSLPSVWYKVKSPDYSGSGYDRGHMIPSADRDDSLEDQSATYYMTNILPQAPDNNQGPWAKLEEYCRELAKQGKELYITAGSYGNQGTIGKGPQKIVVPESVWKIIVVFDRPNAQSSEVTKNTRIIAVDMPNEQGIKEVSWKTFQVSIDQIEAKTGYDFLSTVPIAIQATIEAKPIIHRD
jgi:endonuclease G, mitochondrial